MAPEYWAGDRIGKRCAVHRIEKRQVAARKWVADRIEKRLVSARKQGADRIEKRQAAAHKQAAVRIEERQGAADFGIRQVATRSHSQPKAQDPEAH